MRKRELPISKSMLNKCLYLTAISALLGTPFANATVETGWPVGTTNSCKNTTDVFIHFEGGIDGTEVQSSNPNVEFTNSGGLDWLYADFTTGNYNTEYTMNGDVTTWLGVSGNSGRITFTGGPASYVSLLTKTYSGLEIDAYDADGNHLANSGRAASNLYVSTLTRLTVEADNIAYVEVHDSGNYWTVDDICTDAAAVCQPLPGHTNGDSAERIDLVFVMDEDYNDNLAAFLVDAQNKVNDRLGGVSPVDTNLDMFNFYYTELEGDVIGSGDDRNCGRTSSLPDNLLTQCSFADAVVVLHTDSFGDCKSTSGGVSIFSAEGNTDRSFIHEGGHGLFGLKDEYDSDRSNGVCNWTTYTGGGIPSNIWATETECRDDALNQSWDADECYMFTPCQGDWWKLGDSTLADNDAKYNDNNYEFIMHDGTFFSNGFGAAAERRVNWVFDQLNSTTTSTADSSESHEKSIILNLNISENGLQLLETDYVVSESPNYLPENKEFEAKVFSNNGSLLGNFSFNDPRLLDAESDYSGPFTLDAVDFKLILPLSNTIEKAEIIEESTGKLVATASLESYATEQAPEGDLNDDGIVDRNDITIINDYRNQPTSANPGCDIDGDGTITILDARLLMSMCTYPRCASQ